MYARSVQVFVPTCTQVRGMATLKDIRVRLKSVTNIQKITKSMKMVSAAKYNKAERELKPARSYGEGAQRFYDGAALKQDDTKPNHLVIAMTSDRGLCGGVHSNIVRQIKAMMKEKSDVSNTKLVLVGDKARTMLQRIYKKNILMTFNDIGKKPPVWGDAAFLAEMILAQDFKYDFATMYYNRFKSVVTYNTKDMPVYSLDALQSAEKLYDYDSLDVDTMQNYHEFTLAASVYYAMKECACSEQSSRMTAMDAASKNAGEMIDKLTLTFNRTRQAVITRELIEIISGAAAL